MNRPLSIFLCGLCLTLAIRGIHTESIDELLPLYAATSLIDHGDIDIPMADIYHSEFFVTAPSGRMYPKFGPGQSVILTPFAAVAAFFIDPADSLEKKGDKFMTAAFFFGPLAVSFLGVLAFWMWTHLGYSPRLSAAAALLLVFTSELLPYSRSLFGNLSCTVLLFAAFYAIRTLGTASTWRAAFAGACFAASVAVRPDTVLFLAPFSLYIYGVWKAGRFTPETCRRQFLAGLIPPILTAAALLLFNRHAYGSFFSTGYKSEMYLFSQPFIQGALHVLFSWEKGFVVYSLSVVLSLLFWRKFHRAHPAESWAALLFMAISLYVYGTWYASQPGYDLSYGQRFLLPAVPFAYLALPECLLALQRTWKSSPQCFSIRKSQDGISLNPRWGRAAAVIPAAAVLGVSFLTQIIGCLEYGVAYRRWAGQFETAPPRFIGYLQIFLEDPTGAKIWWVQSGGPAILAGIALLVLTAGLAARALVAPAVCSTAAEPESARPIQP
ncbi:hypothetical protein HY522_10415 [bacterium]|nr:hypothetical protein [bacterium]